ncbi:MAG: tyrosine-type recombinase/integrase [Rhodococcus sp. (in: high G+C Gram-positive bacteria)]|uniref:tyrosine-type recombinase/integrase n=1 Tax=Rhodococcus sp. TaxID=1831 RepID=UPI003D9BA35A
MVSTVHVPTRAANSQAKHRPGPGPAEDRIEEIGRSGEPCRLPAPLADTHSPASILRCWSTWNALGSYLFTSDLIVADPMDAVLRPKVAKTVPKAFDQDAVEKLITALTTDEDDNAHAWRERDLAIVLTALLTGCRLSELVTLNIGEFRNLDDTGRLKSITLHGKGNKQRVLAAEPALVDALTSYLDSRLQRFPGSGKARTSPHRLTLAPPTGHRPPFLGAGRPGPSLGRSERGDFACGVRHAV